MINLFYYNFIYYKFKRGYEFFIHEKGNLQSVKNVIN